MITLLLSTEFLSAQNFRPFSRLHTIETKHFDIIYPQKSESTARALAGFAENVYDRVEGLLGISLPRRVPVMITPDTDEHNGYMNPVPYPHLMLFDTPADIERLGFKSALEDLFLHELTHAVSANTRAPAIEKKRKIFGGWATPAGLTAPWFMIEGVSVRFESLDGAGRANDPLIKEHLRQAVIDGKFASPFQASGVYDLPPSGNLYYDYGGLFSKYLTDKFGMEKYGRLWREMGRNNYHFSMFFYNNGFYKIFRDVYEVPLIEEWKKFKTSLTLTNIENNYQNIIYKKKYSQIRDVVSSGKKIYFIDSVAGKVLCYDSAAKKTKSVLSVDTTAYSLDIS
jgi:hypothetical protein